MWLWLSKQTLTLQHWSLYRRSIKAGKKRGFLKRQQPIVATKSWGKKKKTKTNFRLFSEGFSITRSLTWEQWKRGRSCLHEGGKGIRRPIRRTLLKAIALPSTMLKPRRGTCYTAIARKKRRVRVIAIPNFPNALNSREIIERARERKKEGNVFRPIYLFFFTIIFRTT